MREELKRRIHEAFARPIDPVRQSFLYRLGLALAAMLFIGLTKLVLLALMAIGFCVSNFLSRQMEYDADGFEIRVAGSRAFEKTMYSLVLLSRAFHDVTLMSMFTFRHGVLCGSLPELVKAHAKRAAAKKQEDLISEILVDDTRLFDTHPSPKDRIARARRLNAEGICQVKEPVAALFRGFPALAANLTRSFYLIRIEAETVSQARLLPPEEFLDYFDTNCTLQRQHLIDAT